MSMFDLSKKLYSRFQMEQTLNGLTIEQIHEISKCIMSLYRCNDCHGKIGEWVNGRWVSCKTCNGKGYIYPTEVEKQEPETMLAYLARTQKAAQQSVQPTDGGLAQADDESNPPTISG